MNNYANHSKFVYSNYSGIQNAINSNVLDVNDIIICRDTKELILVKDDYELLAIKSSVYRYTSVEQAIAEINNNDDTYPGQLVAIMNTVGVYQAYLVNLTDSNRYTVTPVTSDKNTIIDYDQITNVPINNLYGEVFSPIVVDGLSDGFYKINGNYKISDIDETIYSSNSGNIFIVETQDDKKKIRKIGSDEICDYYIENNSLTKSVVPTTEWLASQGYITEPYVDAKLEALEYITTADAKAYINNILETEIYGFVDKAVNDSIRNTFVPATDEQIYNFFAR